MDNHNALEQAWLNGYKQGRQAVEKCGPIDVAVVVRCKDCGEWIRKPRYNDSWGYCSVCMMDTGEEFFCGYGERRTHETD